MFSSRNRSTLEKVLQYIRRYWMLLIVSLLLAVVTVITTLYLPVLGRGLYRDLRSGEFHKTHSDSFQSHRGYFIDCCCPMADESMQQQNQLLCVQRHPQ